MTSEEMIPDEKYPDSHHDAYSKTVFGFWIYLLTDFMLFASIFATYLVLRNSTFGGPSAKDLFDLDRVTIQTLIMLASTFTIGLAGAAAHRGKKGQTVGLFAITFVLGAVFFYMMLSEFSHLISLGHGMDKSAYLSAFFTLVGTHGLHMFFALLWIPIFVFPIIKEGLTPVGVKRLICLKMFWQFLNIVWVFIYTVVYLMGVM